MVTVPVNKNAIIQFSSGPAEEPPEMVILAELLSKGAVLNKFQ